MNGRKLEYPMFGRGTHGLVCAWDRDAPWRVLRVDGDGVEATRAGAELPPGIRLELTEGDLKGRSAQRLAELIVRSGVVADTRRVEAGHVAVPFLNPTWMDRLEVRWRHGDLHVVHRRVVDTCLEWTGPLTRDDVIEVDLDQAGAGWLLSALVSSTDWTARLVEAGPDTADGMHEALVRAAGAPD